MTPASNPQLPPELSRNKPQSDDADLGIVDALAQLSFLVQGTLAIHAAEQDVSMVQIRLLGILRDRQPTMRELAHLLELDKSSVTGLVDRAERRGFVQRLPSVDDRRSIRVSLTPTGRKAVHKVARKFQADIAAATACLTSSERQRLSALATRIVLQYGAAS